jgi:amidohydrolase
MQRARLTFVAAACLLATSATAATRPTDAEISDLVAKYSAAAIADREDIHKNPELSNRETRTGALIAAHLKKLGIETRTGVAHTGVVGILKGGLPGRTIAVRADIDALPVTEVSDFPFKSTAHSTYLGNDVGVSHACGHDVHTAALLGTAAVLASLRDRLPGTVMFIFQPAEEGVPPGEKGGAKLMLEEGIFSHHQAGCGDRVSHTNAPRRMKPATMRSWARSPIGRGRIRSGDTLVCDGPRAARRTAQRRTSAVDPIVTASEIVMSLQTIRSRVLPPLSDNVITVGTFRAGERDNIIPETAKLSGTIRTFDDDVLATIESRMRDIFDGVTKAAHATFELSFDTGHPMTVNNPELTAQLVPTLTGWWALDKIHEAPPITGAEDFSYFANAVPGFYFQLGVVPEGKVSGGHHTPTFYAADEAVPIAMRLMSTLVVDYLEGGAP